MWRELPSDEKAEYKKLILAFASLTEMFEQKGQEKETFIPVVNSKFQETVFQKSFHASAEDIGNTSFDASINDRRKYLIGLKTFSLKSGDQKIAQFKAYHDEWTRDLDKIAENSKNADGSYKSVAEINEVNHDIYMRIAQRLAFLRNTRIRSSIKNLQGFKIEKDETVESVYHVLMPALENGSPSIAVGEISYDQIDPDSIEIIGCSNAKNPTNFVFKDNNHRYRFTSADSQLLMSFNNKEIVLESWPVKYAEDAYEIFSSIAEKIYEEPKQESFSWLLTNEKGEVELMSGLNSFYGVGSKRSLEDKKKYIDRFNDKFSKVLGSKAEQFNRGLTHFLIAKAPSKKEKLEKAKIRDELIKTAEGYSNEELTQSLEDMLYRPSDELYIRIPNSRRFHSEHPDFFVKGGLKFDGSSLTQSTDERSFKLVFEPSHNEIDVYIVEDNGKAIESAKSMGILGRWILRDVFQQKKYEPLTAEKLKEVGINAVRLVKFEGSDEIHLHFIWIDKDNLPSDYWT